MFLSDIDLFGVVMFFGRQVLVVVTIYLVIILLMRISGYYRLKACPECGNHLKRSQRTLSDRLITRFSFGILPLKRYRCYSCYWEGASFEIKKDKSNGQILEDEELEDDGEPNQQRAEISA